jgi:hypothetical protein
MRVVRLGLVLAFTLLFSFMTVQAQQSSTPPPVPRDAQAISALTQALASMTGASVINDATLTVNATRTSGSDQETGTGTLSVLGNAVAKTDLQLSDGERQQVLNQSGAMPVGSWSNPDGVVHTTAAWNCWTPAAWFFPAALVSNILNTPSVAVSYMGTVVINDQSVVDVRFWQQVNSEPPDQTGTVIADLSTADLYLSTTSGQPTGLSFTAHSDTSSNVNLSIQIQFNNYQKFNGVAIPSDIQEYINNSLLLDLQTQSAAFNSGLTISDFTLN